MHVDRAPLKDYSIDNTLFRRGQPMSLGLYYISSKYAIIAIDSLNTVNDEESRSGFKKVFRFPKFHCMCAITGIASVFDSRAEIFFHDILEKNIADSDNLYNSLNAYCQEIKALLPFSTQSELFCAYYEDDIIKYVLFKITAQNITATLGDASSSDILLSTGIYAIDYRDTKIINAENVFQAVETISDMLRRYIAIEKDAFAKPRIDFPINTAYIDSVSVSAVQTYNK